VHPVRSDRESIVIVLWLTFSLLLLALALYNALGGNVGTWLLVLVLGELVLAGLGRLALRLARPRRRH
jgi:hypothetical protein